MDGTKGSFIPKNPVGNVTKKRPVKKLYIVSFFVYAFFVGTVVVGVGTFVYQLTQSQQLSSRAEELQAVSQQFDQTALQRIVSINTKIDQAAQLLNTYNSIPTLLAAIERVTVSSVQLDSFAYVADRESRYTVTMTANNPDFNVALFQRQQLSQDPVFASAEVSNIAYMVGGEETESSVTFTITNTIAPGSLPYMPPLAVAQPVPENIILNENGESVSATSSSEIAFPSEPDTTASESSLAPESEVLPSSGADPASEVTDVSGNELTQ